MNKARTWMTAKAYAERVDLPLHAVYQMIHEGIIPALQAAGNRCIYRIKPEVADAALDEYMRRPKPLPEKTKEKPEDFGTVANLAMARAGGFKAALKALC